MKQLIEDIGPASKHGVRAQYGQLVEGEGGKWLPFALDLGNGRYLSGLAEVAADKWPVCLYAPVWTCPEIALSSAAKVAGRMAA